MNRRLRVLLVTRHFWPHGTLDTAGHAIQFATALNRRGFQVEVLTPKHASTWTERFEYQHVPVHRPMAAPKGDWSSTRYVRQLTGWMREKGKSFDLLIADSSREELIAVSEAARSLRCRSMAQLRGWGDTSEVARWSQTRLGKRCAAHAKMIDCLVVSNADGHRRLIQQGFADTKIRRAPQVILGNLHTGRQSRQVARRCLASANADLRCHDDDPVMLCVGRMTPDSGMHWVSQSAYDLVSRYPNLRIWMVGDGPSRQSLYDRLRSDGLRDSFAMPGSFADLSEVFLAANLYVQIGIDGLDYYLPQAISAELPLLVEQTEATEAFFQTANGSAIGEKTGVAWFDGKVPKTFRQAVRRLVDDLPAAHQGAADFKRQIPPTTTWNSAAEQYAQLIEELIRRGGNSNSQTRGVIS